MILLAVFMVDQFLAKEYYLRSRLDLWTNKFSTTMQSLLVSQQILLHNHHILHIWHHAIFSIQSIKKQLPGTQCDSVESIRQKSKKLLKEIPKSWYEKRFQDWIKRWHMCIATERNYFEGEYTFGATVTVWKLPGIYHLKVARKRYHHIFFCW